MKIAVTGGIGNGKSYVCKLLAMHGIKVYDCDAAAKRLMRTSPSLRSSLSSLVGKEVYDGGVLQKEVLANFILQSEANKQAVNNIVHPAVAADFNASGIEWLESAILFESGFCNRIKFDKIICVSAPTDIRASRIMARDSISHVKALEWINSQMPQAEAERRSDYVIDNDGKQDLEKQINEILNKINNEK